MGLAVVVDREKAVVVAVYGVTVHAQELTEGNVVGDLFSYSLDHLKILSLHAQTKMVMKVCVGGVYFLMDNEDYLNTYKSRKWYCHPMKYLTDGRSNRFHRVIMNAPVGKSVDHIEKITDNRKANLRICSHAENMRNRRVIGKNNTSGYKGVYWSKKMARWVANIQYDKKVKYLGSFNDKIEAARAYNSAAVAMFGQFAKCNQLP